MFNRLHTYISLNNILDADQYGFRKNCSTETAAFNLTSNILQALDSKKLVGGIFRDLTKAFDSVDHERLLEKLKFYGVKGSFFLI
jgi:retron-type reverse transcriptase